MQSFIVLISLTRMVQPWVARVVSFGDSAAYCWALAAPRVRFLWPRHGTDVNGSEPSKHRLQPHTRARHIAPGESMRE